MSLLPNHAPSLDAPCPRYQLNATATVEGTVSADPDDDHVISCALSAQADVIAETTTPATAGVVGRFCEFGSTEHYETG